MGGQMKETPLYREYQPRPYRPRVSTYWWLFQPSYLKFILRELSCIPVAFAAVLTLLQLRALGQGPQAYAEFQQWLKTPLLLVLNAAVFPALIFHAIMWFNAAPRALAVRIRGKRVPETLIAASHYAVWLVLSGLVAWFLLRG